MADLSFRDLRADEIDVRIATVKEKGISLLLYKDARCDMNILDETVGAYNWQRSHMRENANCIVSIWDEDKKQWISKEDVGTESYTEAEKGLASDSFKRACFNWGIGRELYTAPFIWVSSDKITGKYDKFSVDSIKIKDKKIVELNIKNETTGKIVYIYGKGKKVSSPVNDDKPISDIKVTRQKFVATCQKYQIDPGKAASDFGLNNDSTVADFENAIMVILDRVRQTNKEA